MTIGKYVSIDIISLFKDLLVIYLTPILISIIIVFHMHHLFL